MEGEDTAVERKVITVSDVTAKPVSDKINPLAKKYSYKKVGGNEIFTVAPEVLNFAGFFELNKTYTMKAKIINSSNVPRRIHILPPMTPFFKIKYTKKGMIPSNNSEEVYIQFNPTDYKYYYDWVRIHCEGEQKLLLPIHAYPVINRNKDRLLPKLVNMEDCTVSETSSKKTLYIDCDTPVTFEYIIEWEEQHPDIHVSPMSGEIKALSKTPIEILYRPSTNTTAQASFKLTTTEFNSKPCIVRVVGSAVPGTFNVGPRDNIEIEEYQHSDREDDEPDHLIRKDKPKTLLKNKTVGYQKRPGSGVKLKKIESVKLTARGLEAELKPDELQAEFANTLPTLKIKLTPDEQDFITVYRQLEELDKVKEIKFFRCLGDPPITEEDINGHKDKRQIYIDNLNMDRHDNTRYKTETDNDKVVVDTDLPMELKPQFDLYKNNHFELRKRWLDVMLKTVNKLIIRQRAGKRLLLIKKALKEQTIRTHADVEKVEKYVFSLNANNIEFPKMPVESGLTSIKEKVEAEIPTSFDDMMPFKPIEDLDFEVYKYKPFDIPQMSHYIPVLDDKPKRQGCEHEYTIRGPRGDPETFIKPHGEKIIEMPETFKKPFDMPRTYLINPHPTLRTYVPYKRFTEVDPEFYLQPHEIPRVIPEDDLTIRANKDLDFASRFLRKNDINLINSDIPGYVGINTIEKIPLEVFDPKEGEQSEYKRCVLRQGLTWDSTEFMSSRLPVAEDVDYPSDEDSGNEEEFEIRVPSLHEFLQELEKDDEVIHKLNEERDVKLDNVRDKSDNIISLDYNQFLIDKKIKDYQK